MGLGPDAAMACFQEDLCGFNELAHPGIASLNQYLLWEPEVDGIERNDEVLVVIDLFECLHHSRLATDGPCKVLMCHSILQAHALLVDPRQLVLVYASLSACFTAVYGYLRMDVGSFRWKPRLLWQVSDSDLLSQCI